MAGSRPRVAVIGTGGSISTWGRHALDLFEYGDYGRVLEVDELLEHFPEATQDADVVAHRFRALPSTAIVPADWLELARAIADVAGADPALDGIVVTHGTATTEETAYFLHLAAKVDLPIVVVGAQRPPNGFATDAGINLRNAIRVAGSKEARGLGCLVVLNDEIQSGREVTKTQNFRLQTFRSPEFGVLGHADPDGVVAIYRRPTRRHYPDTEFDVSGLAELPKVDIVYSYAGADGRQIEALVESGSDAIVVAGLAPGLATPAQRVALEAAQKRGVIVLLGSRAGSGRLILRTKARAQGYVGTDNLNPQKARVLAMLGLTVTREPAELQRMFDTY